MTVKCKHCGEVLPFCYFDAHMKVAHEVDTFNGINWKDARRSLRDYRENQPEYPVRARKKRERIEAASLETGAAIH